MTRSRVALLLGAVAVLAVVATTVLAVRAYVGEGGRAAAGPLVVADPDSGASFEVPGEDWEVRGPRSRIYYEDDRGRPTAAVAGAAVYRDGYCDERPGDSNRGFAGFTDQPFHAWLRSLAGGGGTWGTGVSRKQVVLADGTTGSVRWTALLGGEGECAPAGIEVAMVQAGGVHVVLVADSNEQDTLTHEEIVGILSSLRR